MLFKTHFMDLYEELSVLNETSNIYPIEANVDMSRSKLTISDLRALWPDLPSGLENNPKEICNILTQGCDDKYREAIPYKEIIDNYDNNKWWCDNFASIVHILRNIPTKDTKDDRSLEVRFLDFLNAWILERFIVDNFGATPYGGGIETDSLHKGTGKFKPDLKLNGELTEVKLIRENNNSTKALKYYTSSGYGSLYGASQLILYKAGARCPILVTNIIDIHDHNAPAKKVVLENPVKPLLRTLPLLAPEELLKYVNSNLLWK